MGEIIENNRKCERRMKVMGRGLRGPRLIVHVNPMNFAQFRGRGTVRSRATEIWQ